jgi:hypothetical protein
MKYEQKNRYTINDLLKFFNQAEIGVSPDFF